MLVGPASWCRTKGSKKFSMKAGLAYDANGNLFHPPGTQIHDEANGELTYECPQCGPRSVPRPVANDLTKYGRKRK